MSEQVGEIRIEGASAQQVGVQQTLTGSPLDAVNENLMEQEIYDDIFASVFRVDEGVGQRKLALFAVLPDGSMFRNEYYVFYSMLKTAARGQHVFSDGYLTVYLRAHKGELTKCSYIDLSLFKMGDTDAYVAFGNSCIAKLRAFADRQPIDDGAYATALNTVRMDYVQKQSVMILEEANRIIVDGVKDRNGVLINDYDSMRSHLNLRLNKLDNLFKDTGSKGFILYDGSAMEEETGVASLGSYGIKALDDAGVTINEGDMISMLAPSKGGKSKMSVFIAYNMLMQGNGVVSWSIENGYRGWDAMIRSLHFNRCPATRKEIEAKRYKLTSEMVRKQAYGSEGLKALEASSWLDLQTNTSYGRMLSIDQEFKLDTFLDILEQAVDIIHAKFVVVDYLQLIEGSRGMTKSEAISKAYISTLQFLKRKKIAGIFPAQLKQDVVTELSKMKSEDRTNYEFRTGAGESYEVFKTPDVNFCLYGSTSDIRTGQLQLIPMPSRNFATLPPIDIDADFSCCNFVSVERSNVVEVRG